MAMASSPTFSDAAATPDFTACSSAASLASASLVGNELAYEAKDVANIQRQVWQDAGLSADSNRWYELAFTLTAAAGSAGTLSLEVEYVAND